jgi:hypothetical protein
MAEWFTTAQGIFQLIIGFFGLITGGIGVYAAIKTRIQEIKNKNRQEKWELVKNIIDSAMITFEHSTLKGDSKKQAVFASVTASCKTAGIDLEQFIHQADAYVDQCINWYNGMQNK